MKTLASLLALDNTYQHHFLVDWTMKFYFMLCRLHPRYNILQKQHGTLPPCGFIYPPPPPPLSSPPPNSIFTGVFVVLDEVLISCALRYFVFFCFVILEVAVNVFSLSIVNKQRSTLYPWQLVYPESTG